MNRAIFIRDRGGYSFILRDADGRIVGQGWTAGSRRDAELSAKELRQTVTIDAVCTEKGDGQ